MFKVKENPDGTINKYKARLVAKGFHQKLGYDYNETFSPVIKPVTVRILLSLAITHKWSLQQLDVYNAFSNGILEEDIYMTQPPSFENSNKQLVCKLHKAIYGLKQAPGAWFGKRKTTLLQYNFMSSKCDPSLFIYTESSTVIYMLVYVDDIIVTCNSHSFIKSLVTKLNSEFSIKDLGNLDYFLGIEVRPQPNGESKYIRDLLTKTKMDKANLISSPVVGGCKLTKFVYESFSDPILYKSVVAVGLIQMTEDPLQEQQFSLAQI